MPLVEVLRGTLQPHSVKLGYVKDLLLLACLDDISFISLSLQYLSGQYERAHRCLYLADARYLAHLRDCHNQAVFTYTPTICSTLATQLHFWLSVIVPLAPLSHTPSELYSTQAQWHHQR